MGLFSIVCHLVTYKGEIKMKTMYTHQEEMLKTTRETIAKDMDKENKGGLVKKTILCQAPCGFGKSVVIASIIKSSFRRRNHVLFVVHTTELINQMKDELKKWGLTGDLVDVCSIQSFNTKEPKKDYKTIIVDEAHHAAANSYQKLFACLPNAWNIGFTATPYRGDKKVLSDTYEHLVQSSLSVREMIDLGFLADFKILSEDVFKEKLDELKRGSDGDYTKDSLAQLFENFDYLSIVDKYDLCLNGKKTIVYLPSINAAKELEGQFIEKGYRAKAIHARLSKKVCAALVKDFREDRLDILLNVDKVGEGFDVPNCEAVMLLRPTKSLSLHIQQSMRCMRKDGDKVGIILDLSKNISNICAPDADIDWEYYFQGGKLEETVKVRKPREKRLNTGEREPVGANRDLEVVTIVSNRLSWESVCDTESLIAWADQYISTGKWMKSALIYKAHKANLEKFKMARKDWITVANYIKYNNPNGWAAHQYQNAQKWSREVAEGKKVTIEKW